MTTSSSIGLVRYGSSTDADSESTLSRVVSESARHDKASVAIQPRATQFNMSHSTSPPTLKSSVQDRPKGTGGTKAGHCYKCGLCNWNTTNRYEIRKHFNAGKHPISEFDQRLVIEYKVGSQEDPNVSNDMIQSPDLSTTAPARLLSVELSEVQKSHERSGSTLLFRGPSSTTPVRNLNNIRFTIWDPMGIFMAKNTTTHSPAALPSHLSNSVTGLITRKRKTSMQSTSDEFSNEISSLRQNGKLRRQVSTSEKPRGPPLGTVEADLPPSLMKYPPTDANFARLNPYVAGSSKVAKLPTMLGFRDETGSSNVAESSSLGGFAESARSLKPIATSLTAIPAPPCLPGPRLPDDSDISQRQRSPGARYVASNIHDIAGLVPRKNDPDIFNMVQAHQQRRQMIRSGSQLDAAATSGRVLQNTGASEKVLRTSRSPAYTIMTFDEYAEAYAKRHDCRKASEMRALSHEARDQLLDRLTEDARREASKQCGPGNLSNVAYAGACLDLDVLYTQIDVLGQEKETQGDEIKKLRSLLAESEIMRRAEQTMLQNTIKVQGKQIRMLEKAAIENSLKQEEISHMQGKLDDSETTLKEIAAASKDQVEMKKSRIRELEAKLGLRDKAVNPSPHGVRRKGFELDDDNKKGDSEGREERPGRRKKAKVSPKKSPYFSSTAGMVSIARTDQSETGVKFRQRLKNYTYEAR